jgi:predicted transcriptional regulator of viral defense system
MPTVLQQRLYALAEDQGGYFTTGQVRAARIDRHAILQMCRRGVVERVSRGVYRLVQFPPVPHGQELEATLWPAGGRYGVQGVLSHESALRLWELSDANPARLHITVPRRYRIRRGVPRHLRVHYADLTPADVTRYEAVPVTTPRRTILDCVEAGLAPSLLRQAIADGRRAGRLTRREADALAAWLRRQRRPSAAAKS